MFLHSTKSGGEPAIRDCGSFQLSTPSSRTLGLSSFLLLYCCKLVTALPGITSIHQAARNWERQMGKESWAYQGVPTPLPDFFFFFSFSSLSLFFFSQKNKGFSESTKTLLFCWSELCHVAFHSWKEAGLKLRIGFEERPSAVSSTQTLM